MRKKHHLFRVASFVVVMLLTVTVLWVSPVDVSASQQHVIEIVPFDFDLPDDRYPPKIVGP